MHRDGWSAKADRRSVLAYNGEFFPITNAPCLRCIVENASPFSIVFSQLETEWLTIPISFVPFFLPLRLVSFVSFFFFFFSLYSWKILFYFFFYGIDDDIQGYWLESLDAWIVQESETRSRGSINDSVWNHELYRFLSMLINRG